MHSVYKLVLSSYVCRTSKLTCSSQLSRSGSVPSSSRSGIVAPVLEISVSLMRLSLVGCGAVSGVERGRGARVGQRLRGRDSHPLGPHLPDSRLHSAVRNQSWRDIIFPPPPKKKKGFGSGSIFILFRCCYLKITDWDPAPIFG
jgi:hypothetical protein